MTKTKPLNPKATLPSPAIVDLFCGAGGLSYGIKQSGIKIAAGVDVDPACEYPFEINVRSHFHNEDIEQISPDFITTLFPKGSTKILVGCAPCQPFSAYTAKRKDPNAEWTLLNKFAAIIATVQPHIVVMENVPRLQKHPVFAVFQDVLKDSNYSYRYSVVRCADYGVPQIRKRLVLFASKYGQIEMIPPTHCAETFVSVEDTIGRMEHINAGQTSLLDPLHKSSALSKRNLERIKHSIPGGTWRDWPTGLQADCHLRITGKNYLSVYGRMEWNKLSPTITTQFNGFGNGRYGHPTQNRAISLREGALLQTFPPGYSFIPKDQPIYVKQIARLIGNAVPVKLGEAIGRSILNHLQAHNGIQE